MSKTLLRGGRALLWAAGQTVPLCGALTRADVRMQRHVSYGPQGRWHSLDVYRPARAPQGAPLPALLYVHGGAFTICHKETHWLFADAFARAGFVVFNINYRLAPEHPFPAAIQDVARAYAWLVEHAGAYGADANRLAVAGESAGANLALSLALMHATRRPEPWARRVFDLDHAPRAIIAACGLFEVSRPERIPHPYLRDASAPIFRRIARAYLPRPPVHPGEHDLANPLHVLERNPSFERPLAPIFAPVGARDPLLNDTRRLELALANHGEGHRTRIYPDEIHAFHAMRWRPAARRCWSHTFEFLRAHLADGRAGHVERAA